MGWDGIGWRETLRSRSPHKNTYIRLPPRGPLPAAGEDGSNVIVTKLGCHVEVFTFSPILTQQLSEE